MTGEEKSREEKPVAADVPEEPVADSGVDKPAPEELAAEAKAQADKAPAEKDTKEAKEEPAKPMPAVGDKPAAQAAADDPAPGAKKAVQGDEEGKAAEAPAKKRPARAARAKAGDGEKPAPRRRAAAAKGKAGAARRRPARKKKEEKPRELSPRQKEFMEKLKTAITGVDFKERVNPDGELAITVPREQLTEACLYLRDEAGLNYVRCISGVDWKDRLACVYNLIRIPLPGEEAEPGDKLFRLAVHAEVSYEDAVLPSVYDIWPTADYQEREIHDMFGIKFTGHPNLKTLLLPPNWQGGYPLRKDFVDQRPKRQRLVRPR